MQSIKIQNSELYKAIPDRPDYLNNKVVIVDGLVGGGKGMLSPIVGAIPGIEMWIHRGKIEQVCGMHHLDNITSSGAVSLLKSWFDEEFYNLSIVRETNFRIKDMSCVFKAARPWRYLWRLFQSDGKAAIDRIVNNNMILNIMTHANTGYSEPIFNALGKQLVYIRIVRSPMTEYMLNHLARWSQRWGNDFDGMILHHQDGGGSNSNVPFFMFGKEEVYRQSSPMERAVMMLEEWQQRGDAVIDKLRSTSEATIIEIPFERFVLEPYQYVNQIADAVGSRIDWITERMLKKQKVPRSSITDAPFNSVYSKLGWKAPTKHKTIAQEFELARKTVKTLVSPVALKKFDMLNELYVDRYDLGKTVNFN